MVLIVIMFIIACVPVILLCMCGEETDRQGMRIRESYCGVSGLIELFCHSLLEQHARALLHLDLHFCAAMKSFTETPFLLCLFFLSFLLPMTKKA